MEYQRFIKRSIDLILAFIGIIVLLPLFLLIALLIKMDSKGAIFFLHERIGRGGKSFYVVKFRTMVVNASDIGPHFTSKNDTRITRVGKLLRTLSLDEIPQLLNVLNGDMSLVGPRPASIKQKGNYSTEDFLLRHNVLPGITGLAQVNGRSALTSQEKLNYDLDYSKNINFGLDLKILFKTIIIIFNRKGTW